MKQNEIRVGNWLIDPRAYDKDLNKKFGVDDSPYFKVTARDIQFAEEYITIPLTEEILLKCGFSYRNCPPCGQDQWANMGIWSLILPSGTYLTLRGGIKDIKVIYPHGTAILYLHQLQNLYFALTGQELEVNL